MRDAGGSGRLLPLASSDAQGSASVQAGGAVEARRRRGRPRRSALEELACRFHDLSVHEQEQALLVMRQIHMLDRRDEQRKSAVPEQIQIAEVTAVPVIAEIFDAAGEQQGAAN